MPKFIDLTGQRFGRLWVIGPAPKRGRITIWDCFCDCGARRQVQAVHLRSGHTSSCGCLNREINSTSKKTHGYSSRRLGETATYKRWKYMHARVRHIDTYNHVSVCERWGKFENFLADMGECPEGYSLERINVYGNYEPDNCIWIPRAQQPKNTRRSKHIEYNGRSMILSDWAREMNMKPSKLSKRLKLGWPIEQALGLESQKRNA